MAKNDSVANEVVVETAPVVDAEMPLSLGEFCTRLSSADRRVELIGGFEHAERIAGRLRDVSTAFMVRFTAFANQPA